MKRRLLLILLGSVLALTAKSQPAQFYINDGIVRPIFPDSPPQIDALNFVNNNVFDITFFTFPINIQLFDPSDTLNFTNSATGRMSGAPGFRFDTAPATIGQRRPAANFVNDGSINVGSGTNFILLSAALQAGFFGTAAGNGFILFSPGLSQVIASATNIISHGTIGVGVDGLVSLKGQKVDLDRSII